MFWMPDQVRHDELGLFTSSSTLNLPYVIPQDRVTVVINLAALATRGGAEF
jgi:hypothetical protein